MKDWRVLRGWAVQPTTQHVLDARLARCIHVANELLQDHTRYNARFPLNATCPIGYGVCHCRRCMHILTARVGSHRAVECSMHASTRFDPAVCMWVPLLVVSTLAGACQPVQEPVADMHSIPASSTLSTVVRVCPCLVCACLLLPFLQERGEDYNQRHHMHLCMYLCKFSLCGPACCHDHCRSVLRRAWSATTCVVLLHRGTVSKCSLRVPAWCCYHSYRSVVRITSGGTPACTGHRRSMCWGMRSGCRWSLGVWMVRIMGVCVCLCGGGGMGCTWDLQFWRGDASAVCVFGGGGEERSPLEPGSIDGGKYWGMGCL